MWNITSIILDTLKLTVQVKYPLFEMPGSLKVSIFRVLDFEIFEEFTSLIFLIWKSKIQNALTKCIISKVNFTLFPWKNQVCKQESHIELNAKTENYH